MEAFGGSKRLLGTVGEAGGGASRNGIAECQGYMAGLELVSEDRAMVVCRVCGVDGRRRGRCWASGNFIWSSPSLPRSTTRQKRKRDAAGACLG